MGTSEHKALTQILGILEALDLSDPQGLEPNRLAELGITLRKIEDLVASMRAPIDDALRQRAILETRGEPGSVSFQGGQIIVVVQAPRPKPVKGSGWTENARKLGKDLDTYFKRNTSYGPVRGFLKRASRAPKEVQSILMDMVEIVADQPRVTYKTSSKLESGRNRGMGK